MNRRPPILWLGVAVPVVAAWVLWPLPRVPEVAVAAAHGYQDAVTRLGRLAARDSPALHPGCGSTAMLHGRSTPRAIVLLHGITNCPLQFASLGKTLNEGGDNVLIPRLAHHGLADRMTGDLPRLQAEEVVELVAECVGIARGLGDTVVVVGLSIGGVAAAWAAEQLDGVDRAVVLAPAFAPPWRPAWAAPLLTRASLRLPNAFVWWDDRKREALEGPPQCYPRFSTHALAEGYRLGEEVMRSLDTGPPRARDLVVVTTEGDEAVDNARADSLAARWQRSGARVRERRFPRAEGIRHDMIDPRQVGANTGFVYPLLIRLVRGEG